MRMKDMKGMWIKTALLSGLVLFVSKSCRTDKASSQSTGYKCSRKEGSRGRSIGSATMRSDGTIVLMLRAEGPDGIIGDSLVTYSPGDPYYKAVLEHLCGLKPGQSKQVPPWPDPPEAKPQKPRKPQKNRP